MAFKILKVDNSKIIGSLFVLAFIGVILIGDWQAIGQGEPCSGMANANQSQFSGDTDVISTEDLATNLTSYQYQCESMSSQDHQCFWNPTSQITGEFCSSCLATCLSKKTTINFYQFTCGLVLLSFTYPISYVFNTALASGVTPVASQV